MILPLGSLHAQLPLGEIHVLPFKRGDFAQPKARLTAVRQSPPNQRVAVLRRQFTHPLGIVLALLEHQEAFPVWRSRSASRRRDTFLGSVRSSNMNPSKNNIPMACPRSLHPVRDVYHWLRDTAHEAPRPWHPRVAIPEAVDLAATLRRDGVCILQSHLSPVRLAEAQQAAETALTALDAVHDAGDSKRNQFPFHQYAALTALILDPFVLAVFDAYVRRRLYLAATAVSRLEPTTPYEGGDCCWHHDTKGRYLKAFWFLTDVPPDGQRMSYVLGSHRIWRKPSLSDAQTHLSETEARSLGPVVECSGPAGSVVLFDANGIHRRNRNLGLRRDVVVGTYTTGRHLDPGVRLMVRASSSSTLTASTSTTEPSKGCHTNG
jgi:hypothetical protein